jgi:hypothetical protein
MGNRSNSRANTCINTFGWYSLERNQHLQVDVVHHNKFANCMALIVMGHTSFRPISMALSGNGKLGFDSREGA